MNIHLLCSYVSHHLFIVPSEPTSLEVVSVTASSVTLQWEPPQTTNGVVTHYSVQYGETVIDNFGKNTSDTITCRIERLSPDTEYALQLRAHTRVGAGPPANVTVKTCKLFSTNKNNTGILGNDAKSHICNWLYLSLHPRYFIVLVGTYISLNIIKYIHKYTSDSELFSKLP